MTATYAFEIEKGVPMPEDNYSRRYARDGHPKEGQTVYPWPDMRIGDSFAVPYANRGTAITAGRTYAMARGWRFVSRREGNDCRIWRVE